MNIFVKYWRDLRVCAKKFVSLSQRIDSSDMDRDINRLKVVLAEKKRTNKWLSEILDKDPAVISKWVTNTAQPNVEMFIRLAQILSVSVDDLLWTEKQKEPVWKRNHNNSRL